MKAFDDDIVQEYLAECREHLSGIESALLSMEQDGAAVDEDRVNRIFRAAHSIKGGAGFFNFSRIRDLAHKTENVLELIRSRQMLPSPEVVNVLLLSFDKLRRMIENPAAGEQEDISEFVQGLEALAAGGLPPEEKQGLSRWTCVTAGGRPTRALMTEFDFDSARKSGKTVYLVEYDLLHDLQRKGVAPFAALKDLARHGALLASEFHLERAGTLEDDDSSGLPLDVLYATALPLDAIGALADVSRERIWRVDRDGAAQPLSEAPASAAPAAPPPFPPPAGAAESKIARDEGPVAAAAAGDNTVRLAVTVLDSLMNLAGELVLCRNQLGDAVTRGDRATIQAASQSISVVTSEVQQAVMRTRMQPVSSLFQKFTRFVRDTGRSLGKDVRLVTEANDVELDKTIIEGLSDPLSHMVRNAVDHGVEAPEAREAAGKPAAGTVFLRAWHEAGLVVVEVADDGAGLDPEKLTASAVSKGLISAEAAHAMSEDKKLDLIFLPGFSTSERITDLSGRGVGMDVVKTNLDRLGGKLEIRSSAGRGASFRVKLPLTLAIIPSLLVSAGEERVAVPLVNVQKLVRVAAGDRASKIERVANAQVLVSHDALVPLVDLRRSLDLADQGETDAALNIVLVGGGGYRFGLVVERLHETIEIVVKPLGHRLKHLPQYAGATILGDGCVALILDVAGIAAAGGLAPDHAASGQEDAPEALAAEVHRLLLVQNSAEETCGLPLHVVDRVEKVRPEQVQFLAGRRSMQYRGRCLPLVALADAARAAELTLDENLIVVVLELSGRTVGLLASRPVDVVEAALEIDGVTLRQPGVMGSAILRGRTTLILDPFELAERSAPGCAGRGEPERPAAGGSAILFAEDSAFFREHTCKLLEESGYRVVSAPDGQQAWEILDRDWREFRLVLTDVEMPGLDGLQLTRRIRSDRRVAHLPVIVLSSLADEDDIQRGEAAGATSYCVKIDRDRLLEAVESALAGSAADGGGLTALSRQVSGAPGRELEETCPMQEGEAR